MTNSKSSKSSIPIRSVLDEIFFQDTVLNQLHDLSELNIPNLMQLSGLPLRSVNSLYKTEILIHISYLLKNKPELSRQQIADRVGIHKDNISNNIRDYQLPQQFLYNNYQHGSTPRINAAKLLQSGNYKKIEHIYHLFKINILYQFCYDNRAGYDKKDGYKLSGISRDKMDKLILQYDLNAFGLRLKSSTTPAVIQTPSSLPVTSTTSTHTVTMHPSTRLFTAIGKVLRAQDLIDQVSSAELQNTKFLLFDTTTMQPMLGRIHHVRKVTNTTTEKYYKITTTAGSSIAIAESTKLLSDQLQGLIPTSPANLTKDDAVVSLRHFRDIAHQTPSIFSLLAPRKTDTQLEFTLKAQCSAAIAKRLKNKYGNLQQAAQQLGIHYRSDMVGRGYSHDALTKIHTVLQYPDIHHPDFIRDFVEELRYKIQGGRPIEVNYLALEPDLLYLMGLIASDGYGSKKRSANLGFNNQVLALIKIFKDIVCKYFPSLSATIRPMTDTRTTHEVSINHYAVRLLMNTMQIKGDEEHFDEHQAYLPLMQFDTVLSAAFLQGLFDGDGHVDVDAAKLGIAVFHPGRAKNVALLLKRLGIDCWVYYSFQKNLTPPRNSKPKDSHQWNVYISGKKDINKFMKIIGSRHPDKLRQLSELQKKLHKSQSLSSKYNRAPKICATLFRKVRVKAGIPQSHIWKKSIWDFENHRSRPSQTRVLKYIDKMVTIGINQQDPNFLQLQQLLTTMYNLEPVKRVVKLDLKKLKNSTGKVSPMIEIEVDAPIVTDLGLILVDH